MRRGRLNWFGITVRNDSINGGMLLYRVDSRANNITISREILTLETIKHTCDPRFKFVRGVGACQEALPVATEAWREETVYPTDVQGNIYCVIPTSCHGVTFNERQPLLRVVRTKIPAGLPPANHYIGAPDLLFGNKSTNRGRVLTQKQLPEVAPWLEIQFDPNSKWAAPLQALD